MILPLPFDSHNHVHMGSTPPFVALQGNTRPILEDASSTMAGMAIMSTHPRDFDHILQLSKDLPSRHPGVQIVPCFGVHPWFLHELAEDDWKLTETDSDSLPTPLPRWLTELEHKTTSTPEAIVGEIGLDAFHFDPLTKNLVSPVDKQVQAFRLQLELAARQERPVSIHCVRCFGPLMETLSTVKKQFQLPPKLYFHAFGGKLGTVDQLLSLCGRENGRVYFGFAPVVNFRSMKTSSIVRKVGLERLVLETDHEDAARVPQSIQDGIQFISEALETDEATVIAHTTANAFDLYGLS